MLKQKPRSVSGLLVAALVLLSFEISQAQVKKPTKAPRQTELAKLQEEFIKATKDYKASLTKLVAIYEREITKAEEKLTQSQALFAQGLISKNQLADSEQAVVAAKEKVAETNRSIANADTQIASTLLEAQADSQIARTRLRKGSLMRTASYIRYAGADGWLLSDAWKVQRFYTEAFKKQLPIAVFGQGAIHDRWRLDHRNSMDISLHPDGVEGQALLNFLRANGIPFLAFRAAIPGTATGPHIHIGRPSHRY